MGLSVVRARALRACVSPPNTLERRSIKGAENARDGGGFRRRARAYGQSPHVFVFFSSLKQALCGILSRRKGSLCGMRLGSATQVGRGEALEFGVRCSPERVVGSHAEELEHVVAACTRALAAG